jgi:hypothetical protein
MKKLFLIAALALAAFAGKANPACITNAMLQFINPPCGGVSNIVNFPSGLDATNDNGAWRWTPNCNLDEVGHDCDGTFPQVIIYLPASCCSATGMVTVAALTWNDGATGNSHYVGIQMSKSRSAQGYEIYCVSYSDGSCGLGMRQCPDHVDCDIPPCGPPCP